jgi:hypothetical protein
MVIQDLSVLHAVVYTFMQRMFGLFFWYSKVQTFILGLPPRKIPKHISVGLMKTFLPPGMLLGLKTESDVSYIGGVPSD